MLALADDLQRIISDSVAPAKATRRCLTVCSKELSYGENLRGADDDGPVYMNECMAKCGSEVLQYQQLIPARGRVRSRPFLEPIEVTSSSFERVCATRRLIVHMGTCGVPGEASKLQGTRNA